MKRSKFFKEVNEFWRHEILGCAYTQTQGQEFHRKRKRAQMKLSFGMIFSIILIIVFIVFAFFAIKKFLEIQDAIKIGQFIDKLQSDVDKIWRSNQGTQEQEYSLPSKIGAVCFVDYSSSGRGQNQNYYQKLKQVYDSGENLIFYPVGSGSGLDSFEIMHIDLEKITNSENPFCIENKDRKIRVIIEKDFGENLVKIVK